LLSNSKVRAVAQPDGETRARLPHRFIYNHHYWVVMHEAFENRKLELNLHEMDKTEAGALESLLQQIAELICQKVDVSDVSVVDENGKVVAYTCLELQDECPQYDLVETQEDTTPPY